jgi:hypothetical protein
MSAILYPSRVLVSCATERNNITQIIQQTVKLSLLRALDVEGPPFPNCLTNGCEVPVALRSQQDCWYSVLLEPE